jgi:hypothetical protein
MDGKRTCSPRPLLVERASPETGKRDTYGIEVPARIPLWDVRSPNNLIVLPISNTLKQKQVAVSGAIMMDSLSCLMPWFNDRGNCMRTQHTETVISLNSGLQTSANHDQLDQAGQSISALLDKAAGISEEGRRRAAEIQQRLTYQLRTTHRRIADLDAALAAQQQRADRAEQWLHTIYTEIEERFLRKDGKRTGTYA